MKKIIINTILIFIATLFIGGIIFAFGGSAGISPAIYWEELNGIIKVIDDKPVEIGTLSITTSIETGPLDLEGNSLTTPLIIGGTETTSSLTLQSTSGVGEAGADIHFLVGDNGEIEVMTMLNNGNVGIGTTTPNSTLQVAGNITPSENNTYSLGTPDLVWKDLNVGSGSINLGGITLTENNGCLKTTDFHAHGIGGVAGFLKLKQGTTPTAHKETNHSILWSNDDKLYFEKEDGTDVEIPFAPAVEYLTATLGNDQTNFKTGHDVKFDTVYTSSGTSISLNTSTGVFTLEAGKTYKLSAGIRFEYSDTAKIGFAWYDITNSTEISVLASLRSQSSASHYSTLPVTKTIITPTVETQVSFRCVWEGDEVEDVNAGYVWAIVEVMAGTTQSGSGTEDIFVKSTGLIEGGAVSVNDGNNTLIDITAGSGQIVDSTTDSDNPVSTPVTWDAKTGYNLTTTASSGDLVTIYLALDSGGSVVERSALPTPEQRRDTIDLGIAARNDADVVVFAGSGPTNVIHNPTAQLQDFLEAFGAFNIDGNRIQPYGTGLEFKKTEGSIFRNGVNFQTNGKNPHMSLLAEQAPVSPFNYKLGDGTDITFSATQINPDNYDDGSSTLATVANNKWTIQYITVFASGIVEVLYGQEVFNVEEDAINAISTLDFIIPDDSREAIPLAYIIVQQGDTTLSADRFYRIAREGTGGGSVSYWNRTGTELSPANIGDSAILATQTELASYPNFSADPGWTFSGSNTWSWDSENNRMEPIGEVVGDTITDTGIALTSGKTYVVSLSWLKFIGTGYLQVYQGSAGTQKSDYINDGTHSGIKWMFTATVNENLFIRSTGDFHSDTTANYINELSVIEIDNAGNIVGGKLALGGIKPEYYSQLDNYEDTALFFPSNKGIFTTDEFILRNINSGGLDFDETYARPMLSSYATNIILGSSGYDVVDIRADSSINLRTYTAGGVITLNENSLDTDFVLNGNGVEAYKYDAGDAIHSFNGDVTFGSFPVTPSSAPTTDYQVANKKFVEDQIVSYSSTKTIFILGEEFFAGDAGYIKTSDGKIYKTDAGDLDKSKFIGFADTAGVLNDSIAFNTTGVDENQSGLTINETYYLDDSPVTLEVYDSEDYYSMFGYATDSSFEKAAQSIQETSVLSVASIKAKLAVQEGSPTDNVIVRIETDNSGEPSGTLVDAVATATIDGSTLTSSPVNYIFGFTETIELLANTKYWVVLTRDTNDSENYYRVYRSGSSVYANGVASLLMSGTWTDSDNDLSITLNAPAGTISTTPGTNAVIVGRAITTSSILIGDLMTDTTKVETLTYTSGTPGAGEFTHNGGTQGTDTTIDPIKVVKTRIGGTEASVKLFVNASLYTYDNAISITLPTGTLTTAFIDDIRALRSTLNVAAYVLAGWTSADTLYIDRDNNITGDSPCYFTIEGIGTY